MFSPINTYFMIFPATSAVLSVGHVLVLTRSFFPPLVQEKKQKQLELEVEHQKRNKCPVQQSQGAARLASMV